MNDELSNINAQEVNDQVFETSTKDDHKQISDKKDNKIPCGTPAKQEVHAPYKVLTKIENI